MNILTPSFTGSYSGELVYNTTNYTIGSIFEKYVDSVNIEYENIYDIKLSGFNNTIYALNSTTGNNSTINYSINFVSDLPLWFKQQLQALANATLCSGIKLIFVDSWITKQTYDCKWKNSVDFSENNEIYGGATMELILYAQTKYDYQDTYGTVTIKWQDTYDATTLYQNNHRL